jgi:hypothetical protein
LLCRYSWIFSVHVLYGLKTLSADIIADINA